MKTIKNFTQITAFVILALLLTSPVTSQPSDLRWKFAKPATNGTIDQLLADSVGNIYLTGQFQNDKFAYQSRIVPGTTGENESCVFLLKIAPTGRLIWLHSIRSLNPGVNIKSSNLAINQRGELVTVFTIDSETDFQIGGVNGQTIGKSKHTFVSKISKTGNISWLHELVPDADTSIVKKIYPPEIFLDEDGTAYLAGSFEGNLIQIGGKTVTGIGQDAMLFAAKILSDGTTEWLVNCAYESSDNGDIIVTDITNSNSNTFYLGGYINGVRPFIIGGDTIKSFSGEDAFVAMYNKDGTAIWTRSFTGDSSVYIEKLCAADNNDVFVAGVFNSSNLNVGGNSYSSENGKYNIFLARYSTTGIHRQSASIEVQLGNIVSNGDNAYVETDHEGNLFICSNFYSDQLFDAEFQLVNSDPGFSDLMMAKLDGTNLNPLWTRQGTGAGHNFFEGATISSTGEVFFTGTSYNKLSVNPETIDGNVADGSPYLAKLNADGNLDYMYWQSNTPDNRIVARKVASDKYGNGYIAGNFIGSSNVLDGIGLTEPGDEGLFIARYSRVRSVSGKVLDDARNPVTQGYVKIYGFTYFQRAPLNDSVYLDANGNYSFQDIPFGNYILVAIPGSEISHNFVQTYYPSFEYWEFAEQLIVNSTSVTSNLDIHLQPVAEFNGYTLFQGKVQDAEEEDLKSTSFTKAKPNRQATVVMAGQKAQKSTYEIVATSETDAEGNFEFHDINDGSYYLWTDIPGLPVEDVYLVEVSGHSYVSSLDYIVTEEKVKAIGLPVYSGIQSYTENSNVSVYPIPAKDVLFIELKNASVGICDLYDAQGRLLKHVKLTSYKEVLNISEYPTGNYFIRIITDNSIDFRKINFIR